MTVLDKLFFCKSHGISISYIAKITNLNPATLTKWMNGQKNISEKNKQSINIALNKFAIEVWHNIGDDNDRNL